MITYGWHIHAYKWKSMVISPYCEHPLHGENDNKYNCLIVFLNFHTITWIGSTYFRSKRKRKSKKEREKNKKVPVKGASSYVIRICARKLSETTHAKEEILKAIPCMLFRECPPSHIFFLAYINSWSISCMILGKNQVVHSIHEFETTLPYKESKINLIKFPFVPHKQLITQD